ncbi:GtrA family protein [Magnetofaba australis]
MQFLVYLFIGGTAAIFNLLLFLLLYQGFNVEALLAAPIAFFSAAAVNYRLCVWVLFQKNAKWSTGTELAIYLAVVCGVALVDAGVTQGLLMAGAGAMAAKLWATGIGLVLNFLGRRFFVFPEPKRGPWNPSA